MCKSIIKLSPKKQFKNSLFIIDSDMIGDSIYSYECKDSQDISKHKETIIKVFPANTSTNSCDFPMKVINILTIDNKKYQLKYNNDTNELMHFSKEYLIEKTNWSDLQEHRQELSKLIDSIGFYMIDEYLKDNTGYYFLVFDPGYEFSLNKLQTIIEKFNEAKQYFYIILKDGRLTIKVL